MTMSEDRPTLVSGASRSIYYSLTDEVLDLTDEERNKLEAVMLKAMEFEEEEAIKIRQPLEGQLCKYTNVVKGWQYRWFVICPSTGMLEYYMLDDRKKFRPRSAIHLAGAIVCSSEEDSQSFSVSALCGEVYKLKAVDSSERQLWVEKIKSVISQFSNSTPEITKSDLSSNSQNPFPFCKPTDTSRQISTSSVESNTKSEKQVLDEIKESVCNALKCQKDLAKSIEGLPLTGPHLKCSDDKLLLVKAISQASVTSLEQAFLILKNYKQRQAIRTCAISVAPSVDSLHTVKK